jgi:hypothetical protein
MANFAFAKVQTYQLAGTDVYLNFKNVEVGDLEFIKGDVLEAEGNNFQIKQTENLLSFIAAEDTEIKLGLPLKFTYHLQTDDGECYFNDEMIIIKGEDGELVRIVEGEIQVVDPEENTTVKINQDGILVWDEDDDEFVKISSDGIFVQTDGTEEEKNRFILKLVGGIVNSVADFAMDELKDNRAETIKEIINKEFK